MGSFQGINPQDLWLLSEVRFHNSKAFYEEKKPEIRKEILQPLENLIEDLTSDFLKLDPLIQTDPKRMISRIRRDTRFTRDKTLYRENIWISFIRPKAMWSTAPAMWFEIQPDGYSYGVGCWGETPKWLELYRRFLISSPERYKEALAGVKLAGFTAVGESYKKEKPGNPAEELKELYQKKEIIFLKKVPDLNELSSPDLVRQLKKAYRNAQPMYNCLLDITEQFVSIE